MSEYTAKITSRTILEWQSNKNEAPSPPRLSLKGTVGQICKQMPPLSPGSTTFWFYRNSQIIGIDDGAYSSRIPSEIDTIIRCLDREGAIAYLDRPPKKHGRPKTLGATRPITIRLEEDCLEILESLDGNPSEVIRRLLREQKIATS